MIDSRDFVNAKKLADTQVLLRPGRRIAFAGGADCNDHRIWDALDKVRAKHPDMIHLHEAGRGADRRSLGGQRKVPQVAFKPEWTRHKNAAPFKLNDVMLEAFPIGVIVFPGLGIVANLADKARKMANSRVEVCEGWRMSAPGPKDDDRLLGLLRLLREPACVLIDPRINFVASWQLKSRGKTVRIH